MKSRNFLRAASVLQYLLLVALLVVLILFCGSGYERVNKSRSFNYDSRAQLSYIANRVSASDTAGGVSVRDGVLVLTDRTGSGNYETRFYLDSGRLMEEYAKDSAPLSPEKAGIIGETAVFSAEIRNRILTLTTDKGTMAVAIESEQ